MDEFIIELLESRENRRHKQEELSRKYMGTIISFTLNTPGLEKDNQEYRKIHQIGYEKISDKLKEEEVNILYSDSVHKKTGSEAFIVVDYDPIKTKGLMVDIEEEDELGRIFDIDVFDMELNQISRKKIQKKARKCILCHLEAKICIREGSHEIEEIKEGIEKIWRENSGKF